MVFGGGGCGEPPVKKIAKKPNVSALSSGKISWRKWSHKDSARVVGRPIFLFLYSQRSAWCRDLVARCFNDNDIARSIYRFTWPIRVDADQRPDVFERYGMGGLPSLVFLTPDGKWITGSTYLDPDDLKNLLRRIQILYANPDRLDMLEEQRAELVRREELDQKKNPRPKIKPTAKLLEQVKDSLQAVVNRGANPGIEGLWALAEARIDSPLIRLVQSAQRDDDGIYMLGTLTLQGPVVDYEKQLATNAGILLAAADVGLAENLADSLLKQFALSDDILLAAGMTGFRDELGQFLQDRQVYAGWNALAVSGLCAAYRQTGKVHFLEAGRNIYDEIKKRFLKPNGMLARSENFSAPEFLEDQVLMIRAGLDLFDEEQKQADLEFARHHADLVLQSFADSTGGLRDRIAEPGEAVYPVVDRWVPSGNGVAAQVMIRLYAHTQSEVYGNAAESILSEFIGPNIDRIGYAGSLIRALAMFLQKEGNI